MAETTENKSSGKAKAETKSRAKKLTKGINQLTLNIAFYAVVVFVVFTLGAKFYRLGYNVYSDKSLTDTHNKKDYILIIDSGESVKDIANSLDEAGIIDDEYAFRLRAWLQNVKPREGVYDVSSDMNFDELLDIITG